MKYFKHYSNARRSESLSILLAEYGLEAYARYWILLEFLAEEFDGSSTSFRFHTSTIRELVRVQSWTKLKLVADQLSTVRGLALRQNENVFEIDAPILLDLLNRDFKNARKERDETAPKNKIKNKIKDKELDREVTRVNSLPPLAEIWNRNCDRLPKVQATNKNRTMKSKAMIDLHGEENLTAAIRRLSESDFANGLNDRGWVATFDFFLQTNSYAKIIEGMYDNRKVPTKAEISNFQKNKQLKEWVESDSVEVDLEFK